MWHNKPHVQMMNDEKAKMKIAFFLLFFCSSINTWQMIMPDCNVTQSEMKIFHGIINSRDEETTGYEEFDENQLTKWRPTRDCLFVTVLCSYKNQIHYLVKQFIIFFSRFSCFGFDIFLFFHCQWQRHRLFNWPNKKPFFFLVIFKLIK